MLLEDKFLRVLLNYKVHFNLINGGEFLNRSPRVRPLTQGLESQFLSTNPSRNILLESSIAKYFATEVNFVLKEDLTQATMILFLNEFE